MKSNFLVLCLMLFGSIQMMGQQGFQGPTLNIVNNETPCSEQPNSASFCVDITVEDWTNIIFLQTYFEWDPTVLRLDGIQGFGQLDQLGQEDFDLTTSEEGLIFLDWSDLPCGGPATTLSDGTSIFQMCFTAIGSYGDTTAITIPNLLVENEFFPKVYKDVTCNQELNVLVKTVGGVVSTCVDPVKIVAKPQTAFEGDLVCVDFTVEGFKDLTTMQFTLNWDPGLLQFESVIPNDDVRNLGPSSFGLPTNPNIGPGRMTVSWSFANFSGQGITLDDGTTFFQLCFEVVGECENTAPITFVDSDELTNYEITNTVREGVNIVFTPVDGQVEIGACDPTGVTLIADCGGPVDLNDEVCVTVSSDNFTQITRLQHFIEWNPSILQYKEIRNFNNALTQQGFDNAIDESNVGNGILGVDFEIGGFGITVGSGDLYDVCFDVVGLGGNSPFNFKGSPMMVASDAANPNTNIGVAPTNCAVQVNQPAGVVLLVEDNFGRPGDEVCMDVTVSNFSDIVGLEFTMGWESNIATFNRIDGLQLAGAEVSDFESGFTFQWSGASTDLDDGETLFQVCLDMVGEPDECDPEVGLVGIVIEPKAFNSISIQENESIGLTDQKGELCTLFPEGFYMKADSLVGDIRDTMCVPFKVASFEGITQMQFVVDWKPNNLFYTGVQNLAPGLTNFTTANFDDSSQNVGFLAVDWSDPAGGNLPDSTVLFEVCYLLVGPPDDCYPVSIDEGPNAPQINTLSGNGDIVFDPGRICVNDKLFIDALITPVTCPGESNGEIELIVSGGSSPIGFNWDLAFPQFGNKVTNLEPGPVVVTIFDNSRPALTLTDTFMVDIAAQLPAVNAGEDQSLRCEGPVQIANLQGSGSEGDNFTYRWSTANGLIVGPRNNPDAIVSTAGLYTLQVTNDSTGCFAIDSVRVNANQLPNADAGDDLSYTCLTPTLTLNGSLSSSGPDFSYQWTALNGGQIEPGDETTITPTVLGPGDYVLEVSSTDGCQVTDTVSVVDITIDAIQADAGEDEQLGCEGSEVVLNPVIPSGAVTIEWQDINGESLTTDAQLAVQQEGSYVLMLTDENSGCVDMDTVEVTRVVEMPMITANPATVVNCLSDSVQINASVSGISGFNVSWTALDGGRVLPRFVDSLNTVIEGAGDYQLLVSNPITFCKDSIVVTVESDTLAPTVDAGMDGILNCEDIVQTLSGSNSVTGPQYTYRWLRGDSISISESLEVDVQIAGTYYLEVTDNNNGCKAKDSVSVTLDQAVPQITITSDLEALNCNITSLQLNAVVTGTEDFTSEWVGLGDTTNFVSGTESLSPIVDRPGIYQLRLTDSQTGCPAINEIEVVSNTIPPLTNAGEDRTFTCSDTEVLLDGSQSAKGEGFTYLWSIVEGSGIVSSDSTSALASGPGTYVLSVLDPTTGCIGFDTVMVVADTTLPVIRFETPDLLGCKSEKVLLDASNSSRGNSIFVNWTGLDNNDDAIDQSVNNNPFIVEVSKPGRYEVFVIDDITQCEARDTIEVMEVGNLPEIVFGDAPRENCLNPGSILDATLTPITGDFTAEWRAIDTLSNEVTEDPTNELIATAFGVGDYELVITNAAGCEIVDTISVLPLEGTPEAVVDSTVVNLECGMVKQLDGSQSTSDAPFTAAWTVIEGSGQITMPNNFVIDINSPGLYQLKVENPENGCSDSVRVQVNLNTEGLAEAVAGMDVTTCETTASISATLPVDAMGEWIALDNGILVNPAENSTTVESLMPGENRFVWTLSLDGCENYDSDTLSVFLDAAPVAVNDDFELSALISNHQIDLIGNDDVSQVAAYTFQITSNPSLGELSDIGSGALTYNVKTLGEVGTDNFQYIICSQDCPNLCDSAMVNITLVDNPPPLDSLEAPINGITPNGDGLNDELVFDVLNGVSPELYPDNELVIFNRWGDVVFTQRPYMNNWTGTNDQGQELPHGTYYYILRLDVANGVIIRGDITIIR